MFESSVVDSGKNAPRVWTTLASFAMQVLAVGILVLLPLIYTQALPSLRISEAPAPPHAPRMPEQVTKLEPIPPGLQPKPTTVFTAPGRTPIHTSTEPDPPAPAVRVSDGAYPVGSLPGGDESNRRRSPIDDLIAHLAPPPKPDVPATRTVARPSVLLEGNLVRRVEPVYPNNARLARIQGQVTLQAIIDAQGHIVNLKATSGNPLLVSAAVDAVRQWRYRPYVLNNVPIEVETQITVNFTLK